MSNYIQAQKLNKRMETAFKELDKIATKKVKSGQSTVTYNRIGMHLGITGQTVYNYVCGKGSNGYMIEALIEEFNNLS